MLVNVIITDLTFLLEAIKLAFKSVNVNRGVVDATIQNSEVETNPFPVLFCLV